MYYFSRGDEFRKTFAELGSIRSLLPSKVSILTLTATATQQTMKCVISHTAMQDPSNIKLSVHLCPSIPKLCEWLAKELLEKRSTASKTVVFL